MSDFIPDGWEISDFSGLLDVRDERRTNDGEYPLYSLTIAEGVTPKSDRYNREFLVADKEKKKYKVIYPDDIVYNPSNLRWGALARSKVQFKVLASPIYEVLSCKGDELVHPIFLEYLAKSDLLFTKYIQFAEGTLIERTALKLDVFMRLKFPLPPLPEQQKIAAILSSVDDVIEKTRAQIDKLKDLKTGMMQELLTKGIGHAAFKDSPVGRIPEGWDVKPLGEVCDLQVGYAFKSLWFSERGIRLLRGENVGYGEPVWERTRCLSADKADEFRDYLLKQGDLIIGMDRTFTKSGVKISKVADIDLPALLVQRVGKFIPSGIKKAFLWHLIRSKSYLQALKGEEKGMDIPHLSKSEALSPLIVIPESKEQERIAQFLTAQDDVISRKEEKLCSLESLKKSLMQDLLTGKVRVNVDNKENAVA